jgi:hypothetical protein
MTDAQRFRSGKSAVIKKVVPDFADISQRARPRAAHPSRQMRSAPEEIEGAASALNQHAMQKGQREEWK